MKPDLILASSSASRQMLMRNAGLSFSVQPADIDERAVDARLEAEGATPDRIAVELAKAKALAVSALNPHAIVLGCDQTMSLADRIYHKPRDMTEAHANLMSLSGKTHRLNCGAALARHDEIIWDVVTVADMTVRELDAAFVDRHLDRVGTKVLSSVGAYQLEREGIQLFTAIEGDYFTILGLPLLPLLTKLRELGLIDG
ncbi:Maf-like protein [Agrobacterium rosae]|uniref:Nucleoside triphosphate pyrophosphatase n=1 Tax=Agrobacterium rosae TaxID=1972867 RepID=A0AAE5RU74_9HYPH|nr:Maf-like protein [Agrobacterium rosae]KAA3510585.1 Maf-like protein [Agrobacterium rosae]KAA3517303.1 Maf-like protein [Agrobacterium rosae]MCM2434768.1 Maf-like protein [Agrobacterium rosae]MDX8330310.1 Maf-like protein [Agrobacterium rosae]MQB50049.1 Maf-like protein [Agrobacterium rosae]